MAVGQLAKIRIFYSISIIFFQYSLSPDLHMYQLHIERTTFTDERIKSLYLY